MEIYANSTIQLIQLGIVIGAFLLGRFIKKNVIDESNIDNILKQLNFVILLADKYVAYAKQFLSDRSGAEKMNTVVNMIYEITDSHNIAMSKEEIRAIAQKAYDNMIAGTK